MREIKYKLYSKCYNRMFLFDPRWGNYSHGDGWVGAIPFEDGRVTYSPSNRQQLEPNDCEWMQFTGLLDKQDKEIYEGDVVKVVEDLTDTRFDRLGKRYGFKTPSESGSRSIYGPEFIAPVIWNDEATGFTLAYKWADTGKVDDHIRINPEETEVIGNIYNT